MNAANLRFAICVLICTVMLSGCGVVVVRQTANDKEITAEDVCTIMPGMSEGEVVARLGRPGRRSAEDKITVFAYYVSQTMAPGGQIGAGFVGPTYTENRARPVELSALVVFVGEKVVGVGYSVAGIPRPAKMPEPLAKGSPSLVTSLLMVVPSSDPAGGPDANQ